MRRYFWPLAVVAVLLLASCLYVHFHAPSTSPRNGQKPAPSLGGQPGIEVLNTFGRKVVYTTDMGKDKTPYQADCQARGGQFKECGSICEHAGDLCAQICAYTCEW